MKQLVLILFVYLLAYEAQEGFYAKRAYNTKACSLERALILGEKHCIPYKLKKKLKELSLLHIFTPSGLHLSSLFILTFGSKYLRYLLILFSIFYSFLFTHLYALQRVSMFYGINYFLKNTWLSFSLTFLICLITMQYTQSPMSYLFSFIFWYMILSHKKNKAYLVLYLFGIQILISFILDQKINLAGLFINPIFTLLLTLIFPFLAISFALGIFTNTRELIYEFIHKSIDFVHNDFLTLSSTFLLLILFWSILKQKKSLLIFATLLLNSYTNADKDLYRELSNYIYPFPSLKEKINYKKNVNYFMDRKCTRSGFIGRCKLYPDKSIRVE